MTKPLAIETLSLLKPATLDLAQHIGESMAAAPIGSQRLTILNRIYQNMNPAAKARADFARSIAAMGGK